MIKMEVLVLVMFLILLFDQRKARNYLKILMHDDHDICCYK